jgi:hypothetical protein
MVGLKGFRGGGRGVGASYTTKYKMKKFKCRSYQFTGNLVGPTSYKHVQIYATNNSIVVVFVQTLFDTIVFVLRGSAMLDGDHPWGIITCPLLSPVFTAFISFHLDSVNCFACTGFSVTGSPTTVTYLGLPCHSFGPLEPK